MQDPWLEIKTVRKKKEDNNLIAKGKIRRRRVVKTHKVKSG